MNSDHRTFESHDYVEGEVNACSPVFIIRYLRNTTRHELTCHTEPRASYEFRCRTYGSLNISHMIKRIES
nr:MAG TPA_asm: hypothetical protein [Bacteriophage sp.]